MLFFNWALFGVSMLVALSVLVSGSYYVVTHNGFLLFAFMIPVFLLISFIAFISTVFFSNAVFSIFSKRKLNLNLMLHYLDRTISIIRPSV